MHAALASLAGRDGLGPSAAEAVTEADAAMALLRKAVEMGYSAVDAYRTEDALDPLRGRDDFRLLMMDLTMPADPFNTCSPLTVSTVRPARVPRVGVAGPKLASRLRAVSSGAFTRLLDTRRLARHNT